MDTNLKYFRKLRGLTLENVSIELGMASGNLSRFETGKRRTNTETLDALAKLYDVEVWQLLAPLEIALSKGVEPYDGELMLLAFETATAINDGVRQVPDKEVAKAAKAIYESARKLYKGDVSREAAIDRVSEGLLAYLSQ